MSYLTIVHSLSYGPKSLGIPQNTMLDAASVGASAGIAITLPVARLADRIGRRPIMLTGAADCVVWAVPVYACLSTATRSSSPVRTPSASCCPR
nr:hypothetical protein [Streptomyces europaeiscabiei]